jgi:RNA polymerase sigma-70 factor (ECF subfamily)
MGVLPMQLPGLRRVSRETAAPDTATLARWFDAALPRIYGYFLPRVGGNVEIAEDLTQETMLAAVRSHERGTTVDMAMPWLFGIARHKLVDHYRQLGAFGKPASEDIDSLPDDTFRLPQLDVQAIHVRDAIIATLGSIPPRQCAAIVLRYLDDLPVADVATALELTLPATESLLARARRSFRAGYLASNGDMP